MQESLILLGVNIDHVATLRQARGTRYPEPLQAALIAEQAGADGITAHLREDRRHMQDRDIFLLKEMIHTKLNFEMAVTDEMLNIACQVKPTACCLVPEKREELTTEGGLDIVSNIKKIQSACAKLASANIEVSLFIDPDKHQIDATVLTGTSYAHSAGLQVNAGHGLNHYNVEAICQIPEIVELNIGHALIAQSLFSGLAEAVSEMKKIMRNARLFNV